MYGLAGRIIHVRDRRNARPRHAELVDTKQLIVLRLLPTGTGASAAYMISCQAKRVNSGARSNRQAPQECVFADVRIPSGDQIVVKFCELPQRAPLSQSSIFFEASPLAVARKSHTGDFSFLPQINQPHGQRCAIQTIVSLHEARWHGKNEHQHDQRRRGAPANRISGLNTDHRQTRFSQCAVQPLR